MTVANKVLVDGRLLSEKPTGISRYCIKMIGVIAQVYGEEAIIVLVNNKAVMEQDALLSRLVAKETSLKTFNMLHWFLLSCWVFFARPQAYICLNYSGLCFKRPSLKLVITVYDLMFAFVKGFFGGGVKDIAGRLYYGFMVPRAIKLSELTLTISDASKQDIWRLYKKEAVNMSGGNFLEAEPAVGFVEGLGLKHREYFMYAGNARPHKNLPQLLRVFDRYRLQHPEVKLVMVGHSGTSKKGVLYPGFVSDSELVALYQSARALVFPSTYEGFGLPVLEAILNGCPVIASDIPAFREFECEVLSYFVDDNSLIKVMDESIVLPIHASSTFSDKYNWDMFYMNLYRALA